MKKILQPFVLVLVLAGLASGLGCLGGSRAMQVVYAINPAIGLKPYTVFLVVNDRRSLQDLLGPAARDQGLFTELRNDRFDLKVKLPDGSEVTMTNLTTSAAVREAVSRRLSSRQVVVTAQRSAAQLTVEVDIRNLNINVVDSDLVATADLAAKVYRDPGSFVSSETAVTAKRLKLIGGLGGDRVLSEALTQAVNDLDFSAINNY